jgi:hypothetical protein
LVGVMVIFELLGHRKLEKAAVPRDASGSQSLDGVVVFMGDGGLLWTGALGCRKGRY